MEKISDLRKLTPEQMIESAKAYHNDFLRIIQSGILPEFTDLIHIMHAANPCREYQMIVADLESIASHIEDRIANGGTEPWKEIPLAQSEIQEEFTFPQDQEIIYADETNEVP